MKAKHTPGPWEASGRSIRVSGLRTWLADVRCEDDARPMAAAPDLIAACFEAADYIQATMGPISLHQQLRAALAKAGVEL